MTVLDWLRRIGTGLLLIGTLATTLYAGWTAQGWRMSSQVATLKEGIATANQQAAEAHAEATDKVLQAERTARKQIQDITDQLTKQRDIAKNEKDAFITGVRSGAIRLSIPIVATSDGPTIGNSGAAGDHGNQARAELDPAAAQFLDDIATEGDDAIRTMNALIDSYNTLINAYNTLKDKLNVQAGQPAGTSDQGH